jgi:hypothetical protein
MFAIKRHVTFLFLRLFKFLRKSCLSKVVRVEMFFLSFLHRQSQFAKRKGSPFLAVAADSLSAFNDLTTAQRTFSLLGGRGTRR